MIWPQQIDLLSFKRVLFMGKKRKKYIFMLALQTAVTIALLALTAISAYDFVFGTFSDAKEPMLKAIRADDADKIKEALNNGANVNRLKRSYITNEGIAEKNPLRLAIDNKGNRALETLIKNGADVNYVDENGESLLMAAAGKCDYGKVKMLVQAGADVHFKNASGETVMTYAINSPYGNYDILNSYNMIKLLSNSEVSIKLTDFETFFYNEYNSPVKGMKVLAMIFDDCKNSDIVLKQKDKSILDDIYMGSENKVMEYMDCNPKTEFYIIANCVANDNVEILKYYHEKGGDLNILSGYRHYENLMIVAASFDAVKCAEYLSEYGVPTHVTTDYTNDEEIKAEEYAREYDSERVLMIKK